MNTRDKETKTQKDGEVFYFFNVPSVGAPKCGLMVVVL